MSNKFLPNHIYIIYRLILLLPQVTLKPNMPQRYTKILTFYDHNFKLAEIVGPFAIYVKMNYNLFRVCLLQHTFLVDLPAANQMNGKHCMHLTLCNFFSMSSFFSFYNQQHP